ncbi:MAG TPA: universal stress protein, partial [Rubrobacter sp.]|nr:universal stress protein [Rubrobacter sp.]
MFPTKILLAIDGSPHSELAARMAADFATKTGSELHVVHVGHVPSAYAAAESEILDYEFWKEMREFAKREVSQNLEDEVRKIEGVGGEVEKSHVAVGR